MRRGLPHGVIGMELKPDAPDVSTIIDGSEATPTNLAQARMQFPEAPRESFELVGKRRWKDKATGTVYAEARGAVLLSIGDATRNIVAFFQLGDRLVFLDRLDVEKGLSVQMSGPIRSGKVVDGVIRWEGAA
jgi:hypothetical protein